MVFVFWLSVARLPAFNAIATLTIASISLPASSFDYTLCALYIPFGMLATASVLQRQKRETIGMVLIAGAMSPLPFLHWGQLELAGPAHASILVLLFLWCLRYRPAEAR